ncbi:MAG TPA: hypothetical protein VN038_07775, partial [Dyadobacter sp.]|nr:hypothetical protein [Dyadobacter sp.]
HRAGGLRHCGGREDAAREGRLFPDENYADQSHFIREIKKYAGVVPKELERNKNDRFIQFSTLPPA